MIRSPGDRMWDQVFEQIIDLSRHQVQIQIASGISNQVWGQARDTIAFHLQQDLEAQS